MERTPLRPLLALALAALVAGGCGLKKENEKLRSDNQKLAEEKQQLEQKTEKAGVETAEMTATLDDVQKSLEELRIKELQVIRSSLEIVQEGKARSSRREQLKQEIASIRTAVKENLEKLERLEKEKKAALQKAAALGKKSAQLEQKVTALERLVAEMKRSLEEKEQTIAELEERVLHLTQTVETQTGVIKEKETVIDTQTKELNKAFVAVASKKALKEKGLVEKKGSVLGLGGGWLRTGKFDPDVFREIDVTKETEFQIGAAAKKIRILSDHPKESFELVETSPTSCTLKVTDTALFWKGSKYLVVMTPD